MKNETMSKDGLEARRLYYKKWRAEHKASVKLYNKRYWERVGAALAAEQSNGEKNANG